MSQWNCVVELLCYLNMHHGKILQIMLASSNHKMKVHFACNIGTDLLSTKSPSLHHFIDTQEEASDHNDCVTFWNY